jgi:hypothetical protein
MAEPPGEALRLVAEQPAGGALRSVRQAFAHLSHASRIGVGPHGASCELLEPAQIIEVAQNFAKLFQRGEARGLRGAEQFQVMQMVDDEFPRVFLRARLRFSAVAINRAAMCAQAKRNSS